LQKTGAKPFIIPIFLPHLGCPHQCAFCNQNAITGVESHFPSLKHVSGLIDKFIQYKKNDYQQVQIAFYGGNFLGLQDDQIISLLELSSTYVDQKVAQSIRFSTRPDTITKPMLDLIASFPVSTIEIGVQSMDDDVLKHINRGHVSKDSETAFDLLKKRNYKIGAQIMVGLPGESASSTEYTGRKIADIHPDFVRIYPAVVLSDSLLATWYKQGAFVPLSLEETVTRVKHLYLLFTMENIQVIRMGLQASEDLDKNDQILAGPYHPAFGHMVLSEIFFDMAVEKLHLENKITDRVSIGVHPKNISNMRGLKNINVQKLMHMFDIKTLDIVPDQAIKHDDCSVALLGS
jgi:histone acetyltransferase (RNA polymerase elongator complex component)